MNLELTEDHILLRDAARHFLDARAGSDSLRTAIGQSGGFDAELWNAAAGDLGWCAVAVPQAHGGLDTGSLGIVLLMEACGGRLACIPLWSTICLVAPLIDALARDTARGPLLEAIASGEIRAAVALPDLSNADPLENLAVTATQSGENFVLDGSVSPVADLASANRVLVPARIDDGIGLFVLQPDSGHDVEPLDSLDPTKPLGKLSLSRLTVPGVARIDANALTPEDFTTPLMVARLGLAAERLGAAQGCFDLTLAYIAERVQFGRTIASFQAIKHRCAALLVDIAEARSLLYGAAASLDAKSPESSTEIAAAGALTSQVLWRAAEESIQFHGGVGNTWEYDPHFYLRRAQASAHMLGSAESRLEAIADHLIGYPA